MAADVVLLGPVLDGAGPGLADGRHGLLRVHAAVHQEPRRHQAGPAEPAPAVDDDPFAQHQVAPEEGTDLGPLLLPGRIGHPAVGDGEMVMADPGRDLLPKVCHLEGGDLVAFHEGDQTRAAPGSDDLHIHRQIPPPVAVNGALPRLARA